MTSVSLLTKTSKSLDENNHRFQENSERQIRLTSISRSWSAFKKYLPSAIPANHKKRGQQCKNCYLMSENTRSSKKTLKEIYCLSYRAERFFVGRTVRYFELTKTSSKLFVRTLPHTFGSQLVAQKTLVESIP